MQEALRKLVEQSKDMHDDVHQHLADIQEQTKSTADSHKALQVRVEGIQRQLIAMQKQIEETQQQTYNLSSEQIKLKATQTEDRQEIRQDISIIYQRQDNISKAFGEIQSKTEPYIPSEEGNTLFL